MRISSIVASAVGLALAACAPRAGVTVEQVAAMNQSTVNVPSQMNFQLKIKEPRSAAKSLPTKTIALGNNFKISDRKEFVYPSTYEPVSASANLQSVIPATPKDFQMTHTGLEANLTSEKMGSLVIFKGNIEVTVFQGFTAMGGQLGRQVINSRGQLITENRVEMPKLATFKTPVYAAIQPGGSCTFEISHPKKGTSVTLSIAAKP